MYLSNDHQIFRLCLSEIVIILFYFFGYKKLNIMHLAQLIEAPVFLSQQCLVHKFYYLICMTIILLIYQFTL